MAFATSQQGNGLNALKSHQLVSLPQVSTLVCMALTPEGSALWLQLPGEEIMGMNVYIWQWGAACTTYVQIRSMFKILILGSKRH